MASCQIMNRWELWLKNTSLKDCFGGFGFPSKQNQLLSCMCCHYFHFPIPWHCEVGVTKVVVEVSITLCFSTEGSNWYGVYSGLWVSSFRFGWPLVVSIFQFVVMFHFHYSLVLLSCKISLYVSWKFTWLFSFIRHLSSQWLPRNCLNFP